MTHGQRNEPSDLDAWAVARIVLYLFGTLAALGTFGLTALLVLLEILKMGP